MSPALEKMKKIQDTALEFKRLCDELELPQSLTVFGVCRNVDALVEEMALSAVRKALKDR